MTTSIGKRILSGVLAVALAATTYVGSSMSVFASDTLPYLGESARGENQPYGHGYRAEDFLEWSPENDPYAEYMRAQIPLQNRNEAFAATQANPDLSSETQWFTLAGDYGNAFFDSYSYTNEFSQYLFNFWQLTDYYGSWHGLPTEEVPYEMYEDERGVTDAWKNRKFEFGLVNMPNAGYTNAAHKNGVLSIGCIFLPRTGLKHTVLLTQDEDGNFPYAEKLIEMCEYYGFDGWFINQEEAIPQNDVALYKQFMKQMRDAGLYIQWYDSVVDPSGRVSYQNEFNSANSPFVVEDGVQYSDSIFLNYWWNNGKLTSSAGHAESLGVNPLGVVFAGIEAGGDRWSQGYDLRLNLGADGQPMNSIASLGSEFVHDGLDEDFDGTNDNVAMRREKDEFQWMTFERERRWWSGPNQDPSKASSTVDRSTYTQDAEIAVNDQNFDGVAAYITERSVINGDTFVTNFNTGHGLEYMVNGELSGNTEWSNIIIQDILPTWQWWVETDSQNVLNVDFDYGTKYKKNYDNGKEDVLGKEGSFDFDLIGAYNGGSSLVIYGAVDSENFVHLYKTDLDVNEASKMDVTFKKTSDDDVSLKLGVIFKDDPDTVVKLDVENSAEKNDEWMTSTVDLSTYASKKIAAFGLVVDGEAADYQINIGQMKYTSGDAIVPDAPSSLTIKKAYGTGEMTISWDMASYDDVKQYNVYAVKDGKEIFLGGTYDEVFYIKNVNEAIAKAEAAYIDSVTVSPKEVNAVAGDTIDFDAKVNGYDQEAGQVTIVLKAVSADGTESEGTVASHNYDKAVSNVQVTAEDGKLNVTWEGGEADVVVKKEYSMDDRTWTASGVGGCTVAVPTGSEADFARYTMTITTKDGVVTTYDGRMDDSYSRPYSGSVSPSTKRMDVPLSKDWYRMVYTTVTGKEESAEKTITRYSDQMPTIDSSVDYVKVKLIDYRGNVSEVAEVPNCLGVTVTATASGMQAGTTMQFTATVKNYEETDAVTWSISGNQSAKTTISESGLLTVSEEESASRIAVIATSSQNAQVFSSASVSIQPAYALQADASTFYPGETANFAVYHKGEALPTANYTWSVVAQNVSSYGDITSADTKIVNGVLTIGADEVCTRMTVKVVSQSGMEYTMNIRVSALYAVSPQNAQVAKGASQQFAAQNNRTGEKVAASDFEWSLFSPYANWGFGDISSADTKVHENGLFTMGADEECPYIKITATHKTTGASYSANISQPYGYSLSTASVEEAPASAPAPTNTDPTVSQEVVWIVEGAKSADTRVDENGALTIGIDETAEQLYVTAISAIEDTKSDTAVVNVTPREKCYVGVIAGEHGTVTPGSGEYCEGTDVVFTFTPDKGYMVDKVTVDGKEVELADGKYKLTVSGMAQIEASFKVNPDVPDTGDYTPILASVLLAALAAAGAAVYMICRKRI